MGGTSTDVSLIDNGIRRTHENRIGDFPVRLQLIDIHTVGAGGGSIAYLDRGGALRVGPRSAGADPGPACYGRGLLPTVTDANIVLGRLVPDFFLGGHMKIFPEKSAAALKGLAKKMGKSVTEAAAGVIAVANANMEKAIRVISVERGFDPRRFALFAFGGAGGLHAVELAARLNIARVIAPQYAGVLSAMGMLLADSVRDYTRALLMTEDRVTPARLEKNFRMLEKRGLRDMIKDGFKKEALRMARFLDLRYQGQSFEITLPFRSRPACLAAFRKAHERLYAYHHPDQPVEIVNIRVKVTGRGEKIRLKRFARKGKRPEGGPIKKQDLIFEGRTCAAPVFVRSRLAPGNQVKGPALIADDASTTFLPPGRRLEVDDYLNLVID
jgi:N-methylhydantoinase A/oxoprolinase/acetone carboxylase beta subunit